MYYKTPLNSYCAGKLTHLFDCNITQWEIWIRCHRTEVEMRRHVRLQIKNWKRLKHCESNLSLQSDDSTSQMAHGWSSSQLDMPPKQVFYLKGRPVQTWCVTKSLSLRGWPVQTWCVTKKSHFKGRPVQNLMCFSCLAYPRISSVMSSMRASQYQCVQSWCTSIASRAAQHGSLISLESCHVSV